jgi:hypothetical protein
VIDSLYAQWHPQIVNDIHQQGPAGSRIFVPPYMDPGRAQHRPGAHGRRRAHGQGDDRGA